jgi:glycerol-3-phosphate dehydrogenase
VYGVRYTTARATAEHAVNAVFRALGHSTPPRCDTAETSLFGGSATRVTTFMKAAELRDVGELAGGIGRLVSTYGTGYDRVVQIARDGSELARPLSEDCPVLGAEILYAATQEMAVKLSDAVMRRTEAGSAGHPGSVAVERAASIMASAHRWNNERTRTEIAELDAYYRLPRE